MIQDIAPHTYHNEYKPSAPDKDSFILAYEKGSILLPRQERDADITFPRFQELEEKISMLIYRPFQCCIQVQTTGKVVRQ